MQPDISQKVAALEQKIDAIYASVEKTRKYFLWTMIISVVLFVVPLIGLVFALPSFMSSYVDALGGADIQNVQGLDGLMK